MDKEQETKGRHDSQRKAVIYKRSITYEAWSIKSNDTQ
jgi:hypothetical protein